MWAGPVEDYNDAVDATASGNSTKAIELWRRAAEQGLAQAQFAVGLAYYRGAGVLQDYAEARKWLRKAAEHGYPEAQFFLAHLYIKGEGLPVDFIIGHMWANIAALNGIDKAAKGRELVTRLMTQSQIAEAQRRAKVCLNSNYQNCD